MADFSKGGGCENQADICTEFMLKHHSITLDPGWGPGSTPRSFFAPTWQAVLPDSSPPAATATSSPLAKVSS